MSARPPSPRAATPIHAWLVLTVFGYVAGIYLVARALAEPFNIDVGDSSSYHRDWGGPHLVGVLAVHMLPGVASLTAILWHRRRVQAARS